MRRLTSNQVACRLTKLVQALQSLPVSQTTTPGAMVIKKVGSHATSLRKALAQSIAEQTSHSQTCKRPSRRAVAASILITSLLSRPPTSEVSISVGVPRFTRKVQV